MDAIQEVIGDLFLPLPFKQTEPRPDEVRELVNIPQPSRKIRGRGEGRLGIRDLKMEALLFRCLSVDYDYSSGCYYHAIGENSALCLCAQGSILEQTALCGLNFFVHYHSAGGFSPGTNLFRFNSTSFTVYAERLFSD